MQENIWLPWIKSCTFKQCWHSCPCFIRNGYYKLPFSHDKAEMFYQPQITFDLMHIIGCAAQLSIKVLPPNSFDSPARKGIPAR